MRLPLGPEHDPRLAPEQEPEQEPEQGPEQEPEQGPPTSTPPWSASPMIHTAPIQPPAWTDELGDLAAWLRPHAGGDPGPSPGGLAFEPAAVCAWRDTLRASLGIRPGEHLFVIVPTDDRKIDAWRLAFEFGILQKADYIAHVVVPEAKCARTRAAARWSRRVRNLSRLILSQGPTWPWVPAADLVIIDRPEGRAEDPEVLGLDRLARSLGAPTVGFEAVRWPIDPRNAARSQHRSAAMLNAFEADGREA